MTAPKLDLLLPANYPRFLKAEIKAVEGQEAPLRYVYDRVRHNDKAKEAAVVFVGDVGAGMVSLMRKVEDHKVLIGKIAETEKAFLFEIGSQLTDKAMTVQLLDVGIRKPVLRVKDLAAALEQLKQAATAGKAKDTDKAKETDKGTDKDKGTDPLVEKAEKAFAAMKQRVAVGLKNGPDNHKKRLAGAVHEYNELVKAKSGKEAVAAVVSIAKVLELLEQADPLQARIADLESRRDRFKDPVLHPKHLKTISETFDSVRKAMAGDSFDARAQTTKLDVIETLLDNATEQVRVFRDQKAEHEGLAKEIAKKDRAAVAKTPKKKALEALELAVKQLTDKAPKDLQVAERYAPFADLIEAEKKLLAFLREALKPTTVVDRNTVEGRKSIYVYDEPDTWVMNPVVFRNGTSNSSLSSQQLDLLSKGQLRSNTTASGSVLKVGFEGHAHTNGGSGGVAFVYQLDEAQYKVTPIVVDTASSRGNNKDKNKYHWDTGGLDYFPPNARY